MPRVDAPPAPPAVGEVVILPWLSAAGKTILVAVGPHGRERNRLECDDADIDRANAFLYRELVREAQGSTADPPATAPRLFVVPRATEVPYGP